MAFVVPAIDISNGQSIFLTQGDWKNQTRYENPEILLERYCDGGALMINLIDLDGACEKGNNSTKIKKMAKRAQDKGVIVNVGGGIRTLKKAREFLNSSENIGIIIGTAALANDGEKFLKKISSEYGPHRGLILALDYDARTRKVVANGWKEAYADGVKGLVEIAKKLGDYVTDILVTRVDADGTMSGVDADFYSELRKRILKNRIMAAGGINSLEDVEKLRNANVDKIVIGKALKKRFALEKAIRVAQL